MKRQSGVSSSPLRFRSHNGHLVPLPRPEREMASINFATSTFHRTLYRFKCPCTGEKEDHELHMLGYQGMSMPPRWVDTGSYYECIKCRRRVPWSAPPPPPPPPPTIMDISDPEE